MCNVPVFHFHLEPCPSANHWTGLDLLKWYRLLHPRGRHTVHSKCNCQDIYYYQYMIRYILCYLAIYEWINSLFTPSAILCQDCFCSSVDVAELKSQKWYFISCVQFNYLVRISYYLLGSSCYLVSTRYKLIILFPEDECHHMRL